MTDHSVARAGGDPTVPVPRQVDLARWLWIASAVVGFAGSLIVLSDRSALVSALRKTAPQMPQQQVDKLTNIDILSTIISSLAVLALFVALATRMVRGRQWARMVISVLSMLSLVVGAGTLVPAGDRAPAIDSPMAPVDMVLTVVLAAMYLAVLVLLFHPVSNRFFRDCAKAHRTSGSRPGG